MTEEWLAVEGWPYEVSNMGRVKRSKPARGTRRGRILKPATNTHGYLRVCLYLNGVCKTASIHRLVTEAFIGPCPDGRETNHKSGEKADNRLSNLEYVTRSENLIHAYRNGLRRPQTPPSQKGTASWQTKLIEQQVEEIRGLAGALTQRKIGKRYGLTQQTVSDIIRRETWRHVL